MRNVRNILAVSCGYAAAVIGAGFASGQEIVSFFLRYGKMSIVGILIACTVFSLFSYAVLGVCVDRGINNYEELLRSIFRGKAAEMAVGIMTVVFAACSVCVMTACAGELGAVFFGAEKIWGALAFSVICLAVFMMNGTKIINLNSVMGAVIIFGIVLSCFYILRFREHQVSVSMTAIAVSGASYAGYNLLTAGAILSGMSHFLQNKKEALLSAVVSGGVLMLMILLIWGVLGIYYGKINLGEIPMLTMAFRQNRVLGVMYGVMLVLAILSTGVSNGFGIIDIVGSKIGGKKTALMLMFVVFCMSGTGFSRLIDILYRFCGYIGFVIVAVTIFKAIKNMKKVAKER